MYIRDQYGKFIKGSKSPTMFKIGHPVSEITRLAVSRTQKGRIYTKAQKIARSQMVKDSWKRIPIRNRCWGSSHPCWNPNKIEDYPYLWRKIRGIIRALRNFTCQRCGIHQEELKEKLIVHHIDENKQNLEFTNLMAVCRKCHLYIHWDLRKNGQTMKGVL